MTYCEFTKDLPVDHLDRIYHDTQYGFPLDNDDELFGRLILEINQAGLSWSTILKKQSNFRHAYSNFEIHKIANYDQGDIDRLLGNKGIIRNRLKINAAIYNARIILQMQQDFGSFKNWLDQHKLLSLDEWTALFREHFKFVGGLIVEEFLMSTGYLKGAHEEKCPIFEIVLQQKPTWDQH